MYTIVWTNAQEKATGMGRLAERVASHHTYEWAEAVSESGETTLRSLAREDTGWMKSSATSRSTAMGGVGISTVGYGVTRANPFYTKFQEHGTRHGIKAMLSVPQTAIQMRVAAENSGETMLNKIAAEWNSI